MYYGMHSSGQHKEYVELPEKLSERGGTARALCNGEDPELWFPTTARGRRKAKAICERCPMQASCLEHALKHKISDGVWGGLTADERRKILHPPKPRRRREPVPAPPPSEVRGVSWNGYKGTWMVTIRHGSATHWVGYFADQQAAEAAAIVKCEELGTTPVRSRSGKRAA